MRWWPCADGEAAGTNRTNGPADQKVDVFVRGSRQSFSHLCMYSTLVSKLTEILVVSPPSTGGSTGQTVHMRFYGSEVQRSKPWTGPSRRKYAFGLVRSSSFAGKEKTSAMLV
jgi:hypothetical protein